MEKHYEWKNKKWIGKILKRSIEKYGMLVFKKLQTKEAQGNIKKYKNL